MDKGEGSKIGFVCVIELVEGREHGVCVWVSERGKERAGGGEESSFGCAASSLHRHYSREERHFTVYLFLSYSHKQIHAPTLWKSASCFSTSQEETLVTLPITSDRIFVQESCSVSLKMSVWTDLTLFAEGAVTVGVKN